MVKLRMLTLFSVLLAIFIFFCKPKNPTTIKSGEGLIIAKEWLINREKLLTPKEDSRPGDQTFLTFPEWFLVFSPEEQATYFKNHTSSTFPYMTQTAQIWESYKIINDQIKDNYSSNTGYHFMIWVIGLSSSVEYSLKSIYETVIGRITDTHEVITDEDKFYATFTNDYVAFIKDKPWYEFDFTSRLQSFWSSSSIFGLNFIRKAERKFFITSELIAKIIYGKLLGIGTKSVYEEALPTTAVVIETDKQMKLEYKFEKQFADNIIMINLPRYHKFTAAIIELEKTGCKFKEIAGNNSAILLTVIVDVKNSSNFLNAKIIFSQSITYNPKLLRVALVVPVGQLSDLLKQMNSENIKVEHIFDF